MNPGDVNAFNAFWQKNTGKSLSDFFENATPTDIIIDNAHDLCNVDAAPFFWHKMRTLAQNNPRNIRILILSTPKKH